MESKSDVGKHYLYRGKGCAIRTAVVSTQVSSALLRFTAINTITQKRQAGLVAVPLADSAAGSLITNFEGVWVLVTGGLCFFSFSSQP